MGEIDLEKLGKITSFHPHLCGWCREIRQKYLSRATIAKELGLECFEEFVELSENARCPFHRATVQFWEGAKKRRIRVIKKESYRAIEVSWWSNNYDYMLIFNLNAKEVVWETNYRPSQFDTFYKRFDFDAMLRELLLTLTKDELLQLEDELPETKD